MIFFEKNPIGRNAKRKRESQQNRLNNINQTERINEQTHMVNEENIRIVNAQPPMNRQNPVNRIEINTLPIDNLQSLPSGQFTLIRGSRMVRRDPVAIHPAISTFEDLVRFSSSLPARPITAWINTQLFRNDSIIDPNGLLPNREAAIELIRQAEAIWVRDYPDSRINMATARMRDLLDIAQNDVLEETPHHITNALR